MTTDFFMKEMKRLQSVFGPENFPKERNALIWSHVSDLPERNFRIIIDHFIGNTPVKYPPVLSDFIEQALFQKKALFNKTVQNHNIDDSKTDLVASENALTTLFEELGAVNILDAMEKMKRSKPTTERN